MLTDIPEFTVVLSCFGQSKIFYVGYKICFVMDISAYVPSAFVTILMFKVP